MLRHLLASAVLLSLSTLTLAHEFKAGDLMIDHPWARELPPTAATSAAFFTLHNHGAQEDRLLGASTPVAGKAELHTHIHMGEVMRMQKIDSASIPAHGMTEFVPGGNHVMLFDLKQPLKAGDSFPLTLQFEKAGKVEVTVNVEAAPAQHEHQSH